MKDMQAPFPDVPKPILLRRVMPGDWRYGDVYGYTKSQMIAYAKLAVAQSAIADTRGVTINDLLQLVPNSKAAKRYEELMADLGRLQEIIAAADEWAVAGLPSRIEPSWLAYARKYLGTD